MAKSDREWYLRFVEDSSYQQRIVLDQPPDKNVRLLRQYWATRNYDRVIEFANQVIASDGKNAHPAVFGYLSMALGARGQFAESLSYVCMGIDICKRNGDSASLAAFYNYLAVRLYALDGDYDAAEHYARKGWVTSADIRRTWPNIITICEMQLARLRDNRCELANTINEIDQLLSQVFHRSQGSVPQDFINYIYRNISFEEYRAYDKGRIFKARFGNARPN